MIKNKIIGFLWMVMVTFMVEAAENSLELYKTNFQTYQKEYLTSAHLLIAQEDKILYSEQAGFFNAATKQRFTFDNTFPIASITKQFTAVGILLLADKYKWDLHQPINKYFPASHPIWQGRAPVWAGQVTLHHLLTHSSGIGNYTSEKIESTNLDHVAEHDLIPSIISLVKDEPLKFQPGEKFEYNNTGYLLLSEIIREYSSEKDVGEFLNNRIFRPLGMKQSYLPTLAAERVAIKLFNQNKHLPIRYIADLEKLDTLPRPMSETHLTLPLSGAGAMISSMKDLLKWQQGLYEGKVLSAQALKEMTTPYISGEDGFFGLIKYGYGLFIDDEDPNHIIYSHGGWIQGIRTELSFAPANKISYICFSNLSPDETLDEETMGRQVKAFNDLGKHMQMTAKSVTS